MKSSISLKRFRKAKREIWMSAQRDATEVDAERRLILKCLSGGRADRRRLLAARRRLARRTQQGGRRTRSSRRARMTR